MVIALISLLGAGAVHDTWFAQSEVGTRVCEQRAWALAELGLRAGAADLAATLVPDESLRELRPALSNTARLTLRIRKLHEQPLPTGFSLGRLSAQEFEIESTGYSARRARRTVVQGLRRIVPTMEAAP